MQHFRITGLPASQFAHVFRTESYHQQFPARPGLIEITHITRGCLNSRKNGCLYSARAGDITCDLFEAPQQLDADGFHEHHTVGFRVEIAPADPAEADCLSIPYLTEDSPALRSIRGHIDEIIRHRTLYPGDDLHRAGRFLMLLSELHAYHRAKQPAGAVLPHAERAKQYIAAHLHEPISQREIAAELGITPEYLCADFKESEGETLIRYANHLTLGTILAIMQNERIPLAEAAAMYGYSDPNYVSRLYRRCFGRTITEALEEKLHVYDGSQAVEKSFQNIPLGKINNNA